MQAIIEFETFNNNCRITFNNVCSDSIFDAGAAIQITEFAQDLIDYASYHNGALTYSREELEKWLDNK